MSRLLLASDTHRMRIASFLLFAFIPCLTFADNPHWIWHDNHGKPIQTNEVRFFRKTFQAAGKITKVHLSVAADDEAVVYIYGRKGALPSRYAIPGQNEI